MIPGQGPRSHEPKLRPGATKLKKKKREKKKTPSGSDTGYGKIRENATVGYYLREVVRVTWERESAMERAVRTRSQSTC